MSNDSDEITFYPAEAPTPDPDASRIIHAIRSQLESTINDEIRKATEEAVPRIREALLKRVGQISVGLFKNVQVITGEDEILIKVDATGLKGPT